MNEADLYRAATTIREADALLICAGAGMGVDSGLPDFRGPEGFWRAYPPFARLNLHFKDIASPYWFEDDPPLAWGFYGHRLNLYRHTEPHEGYTILRQWAESKRNGYFVYTSNVDGHFEKAGFAPERIVECHGSIHYLQCNAVCHRGIWEADIPDFIIPEETMRATSPLPRCPKCGSVARPNVLMFGDGGWIEARTDLQERRLEEWLRKGPSQRRLTIIECGAGNAIPTVRWFSNVQRAQYRATLIRINPRECSVPDGQIALPLGAKDALLRLNTLLS